MNSSANKHYYISFTDPNCQTSPDSIAGYEHVAIDAMSSMQAVNAFEDAAISSGVCPSLVSVSMLQ